MNKMILFIILYIMFQLTIVQINKEDILDIHKYLIVKINII